MKTQAQQLRETAQALRYRSSQGSSIKSARKWAQVRELERLAARLERRELAPVWDDPPF